MSDKNNNTKTFILKPHTIKSVCSKFAYHTKIVATQCLDS